MLAEEPLILGDLGDAFALADRADGHDDLG
jgi:hypothetical protein